ncbi:uncharacterized protein LOC134527640 isoform X2 [Bacillus rossius redtenbacheri]
MGGRRKPSCRGGGDSLAPDTPTPTESRHVSFSTADCPSAAAAPVSLATLDRDCFIIPVARLDRFLPAGVPMPLLRKSPGRLSMLEVDDPKLCMLMHLMTSLEPIDPVLESPLDCPATQQRSNAIELLNEVGAAKAAAQGMLLANLEKNAEFPFISYYVVDKRRADPEELYRDLRAAALRRFHPRLTRHTVEHTLELFDEVATIARPPLDPRRERPPPPATGYIVSVYRVFQGDDREALERNWLYWTGARMLYRYLPKSVGLRRITLHKSVSGGDKMYLLLCECSNFLDNLSAAAILLPAMRARLCGYTGLYRTCQSF